MRPDCYHESEGSDHSAHRGEPTHSCYHFDWSRFAGEPEARDEPKARRSDEAASAPPPTKWEAPERSGNVG